MLAVPRVVPPAAAISPLPTSSATHPLHINNAARDRDDDADSFADLPSQRQSISDDRFYLPVCSPVVTNQPVPLPTLSEIPGNFPSTKDDSDVEAKPTKRTSPLTVVQTGVFYFFSCGWCGMNETSKRVRKDADVANESLRDRWKYEIENRPKALRKLIKTTADNVETNIVPSIMARMSHHYHYYTGTEPTTAKSREVMSMSSSDTYQPNYYSRWRGREVYRQREGSHAAPPIQNFAESASATYVMNNDLMWMMEPPPAPVWKSDGKQGPRLALAEEDEMLRENIQPRLVSKPIAPTRPKPTIMRIPTLPSIESLASRVAEEQQQEKEKSFLPPPPAVLLPSTSSNINRRNSRPTPLLFSTSTKENSVRPASPVSPPFSAPARSLSWETATETTSRSSSDREFNSYGSDGTASPTTIYSTVPQLCSPSLIKSALATKDGNGNPESLFLPRNISIQSERDVSIADISSNNSSFVSDKLVNEEKPFAQTIESIVPDVTDNSESTYSVSPKRQTRRYSTPLSGLRI
ncbi:hypothetical protein H072_254 [Dactylellina haptotyla CBS 200.50]|uniref:Uncharacterized protein n=1 Tax=Dactylellina haptotyla (strain CBS 200.50) TaxID=1284197 RepID=S8AY37_DACHA|nr:hypothetical protein H072_254 [Dactylellina haptotyla CBS 200.50]